jgi:hypothetical protein
MIINLGIKINNTKEHVYYMGYYTVSLCIVGAFTSIFIKEDLVRSKKEALKQSTDEIS